MGVWVHCQNIVMCEVMICIEIKVWYFQTAEIDVVSVLNFVVCDDLLKVRIVSQIRMNETVQD